MLARVVKDLGGGDSEGTLGGLVQMTREEILRSMFASEISMAQGCSADSVCTDAGERGHCTISRACPSPCAGHAERRPAR